MAVLVAVLRELTFQRAIWRFLARGGWWELPCSDISDQAVEKRLEQEGWQPLACVCAQLSQIFAQWVQPALHVFHTIPRSEHQGFSGLFTLLPGTEDYPTNGGLVSEAVCKVA